MAGISVTRSRLEALYAEKISEERHLSIHETVLDALGTAYFGEIDQAEGRAAATLNNVYTSVFGRLLVNARGARSLNLGSGGVTMGGTDEDVSAAAMLTARERMDLSQVTQTSSSRRRRFATVRLHRATDADPCAPVPLPFGLL